MMVNGNPHPGRSVEFLSRLHDGELSAAERARFESHRARCAECRRAALEFEDALAMFRSARSAPPRADLAARILRRVQSTNRPRVPFPPRFRVDLGWAGLLAAALLAILIATPIALRRPDTAPSPATVAPADGRVADAPVPPDEVEKSAEKSPRVAESDAGPGLGRSHSADRPRQDANAASGPAVATDAFQVRESAKTRQTDAATARPVGSQVRDQVASARGSAAAPPPAASVAERRVAAAAESPAVGGEGASATSPAPKEALRLSIEPIDGFGPAPALRTQSLPAMPPAGGREFVVIVDSQGTVRRVSEEKLERAPRGESEGELKAEPEAGPRAESRETIRRKSSAALEAAAEDEVAAAVAKLRFDPGNRPRRLLVRVE